MIVPSVFMYSFSKELALLDLRIGFANPKWSSPFQFHKVAAQFVCTKQKSSLHFFVRDVS